MSETAASALPTEEDYRRYDRVWQRVSPALAPYPRVRAAGQSGLRPPEPDAPAVRADDAQREAETVRRLLRDELAEEQIYRSLAPLAPSAEGRRLMNGLAAAEAAQVRTLRAVCFLLTGEAYGATVVLPPQPRLPWRDRLRGRYHAELESARAYERAAAETADVGRRELFADLAREEYRHAGQLRRLVEKLL